MEPLSFAPELLLLQGLGEHELARLISPPGNLQISKAESFMNRHFEGFMVCCCRRRSIRCTAAQLRSRHHTAELQFWRQQPAGVAGGQSFKACHITSRIQGSLPAELARGAAPRRQGGEGGAPEW